MDTKLIKASIDKILDTKQTVAELLSTDRLLAEAIDDMLAGTVDTLLESLQAEYALTACHTNRAVIDAQMEHASDFFTNDKLFEMARIKFPS